MGATGKAVGGWETCTTLLSFDPSTGGNNRNCIRDPVERGTVSHGGVL